VAPQELNLFVGWLAMLGGVISGAVIGLFFHQEQWMDGYGSFRRRLIRLGHISFFGLGFVNLMFAFSIGILHFPAWNVRVSSLSFVLGVITMPLCCFLTAWRQPFRYLFLIPVGSVLVGITSLLLGWRVS
jgi:hypothetical protein